MSNILHTLALDVDTVQERCILWAQSVDRPDSWIAQIHRLRPTYNTAECVRTIHPCTFIWAVSGGNSCQIYYIRRPIT